MAEAVEQIRQQIEVADQTLFDLLNQRLELSKRMAEAKGDVPTHCPAREQSLVRKTVEYCKDLPNVSEEMVHEIYPSIFTQSKNIQRQIKESTGGK